MFRVRKDDGMDIWERYKILKRGYLIWMSLNRDKIKYSTVKPLKLSDGMRKIAMLRRGNDGLPLFPLQED